MDELDYTPEGMNSQQELDKRIEEAVNRRMRKVALRTVLAVLLILALIVLCVSPVMNAIYPNPAKLNADAPGGEPGTLVQVLDAWAETTYPYREFDYVDVSRNGFGSYTLDMHVFDRTKLNNVGGAPNVIMTMTRGKLETRSDPELLTGAQLGLFGSKDEKMSAADLADTLKSIEELPDSSQLAVALTAKKPRKVADLKKEETDRLSVDWVRLYQPEREAEEEFQGGIALHTVKGTDPYREDMTEEELKQTYVAHLELLRDHGELWSGLPLFSGNMSYGSGPELMNDLIRDAEQMNVLRAKDYCVSGKKQDVLDYLKAHDLVWVNPLRVRLSEYN